MTFINNLKGYKIIFTNPARKSLFKLNKKDISSINKKLTLLVSGGKNLDIKKLAAKQCPTYRLRVGNFRVLYEVYDNEIIIKVIRIAHRKEVYEF